MNDQHHAFSFRGLFDEAVREFGSPDRGFFRTTWLMLTAPGHTLRRIFSGEEKNVTTPLRYFLLAYTLFAIVYLASGAMDIFVADYVSSLKNSPQLRHHSDQELRDMMGFSFFLQYPLIGNLIMVLIMWLAALATWFRFPLGGSQKLSAIFYFAGFVNIITLPGVILILLHKYNWASLISMAVYLVYIIWITHTFDRSRIRFGFVRGVAWFLLFNFLNFAYVAFFAAKTGFVEGAHKAMSEVEAPQK